MSEPFYAPPFVVFYCGGCDETVTVLDDSFLMNPYQAVERMPFSHGSDLTAPKHLVCWFSIPAPPSFESAIEKMAVLRQMVLKKLEADALGEAMEALRR